MTTTASPLPPDAPSATPPPASQPRLRLRAPNLGLATAVWWRNVTVYRHTWVLNLLPNFFEPLLYLVAMGIGIGPYMARAVEHGSYLAFLAPGLLAVSAMYGASFETTYNMFVKMNFARLYEAYLCTPVEVEDIALGECMWAVTRAMLYGLAFLAVMLLLRLLGEPTVTSGWAVLLPLVVMLTGLLFALLGQLFTSLVRQIDLYAYYWTLFITPLFLFSGVFFQADRFPYGETIAAATPLWHCVRLCRGLAHGAPGLPELLSLLYVLGACAILAILMPRQLRRRLAA